MMNKFKNTMRGFTLIELLVVIAIIGLLASIVLVSLSSARRKARDSRRVGDLRQVQLALELRFDTSQSYPGPATCAGSPCTLGEGDTMFRGILAAALVPSYIGGMPTDPTNVAPYLYGFVPGNAVTPPAKCAAATGCLHYLLTTSLEETTNASLSNDIDGANGGWSADGFNCGAAGDGLYCVGA